MPSGFHGATQLARVTLLALLGGVEAATANFTGFTGFYSYEVPTVIGGGAPVLRCFVETNDVASITSSFASVGSSSCPADMTLLSCVNASEAYGSTAQRVRAKKKKDEGTDMGWASLFASVVQAIVLTVLVGPSILLLGTAVPKAVIVVQSILQFGYTTLINMMLGADIFIIGQVVQASYDLIIGAVTLIIASLIREEINRLNKGLLTGRLLIYPIIEYAAVQFFSTMGNCKLFSSSPSEEFPFGEPGGCADKYDIGYLGALYIYHAMKWAVIVFVTYLGTKFHAQVLILSCALSGSALQTTALSQLMLSLLRWWDAYWLSQGFVTGRESQGTWLVVTYSNAVYYTLIIIGVLSMLTIRKYVEELTNCEKTKKDIIANLEFRKIAAKAIGATGDPVIRANLRDVKQRATDLCEGLRAKDELELSEIYPLFIGSRKKLAAQLRRELEPDWKEQNNRIASAMFEHKRVATDGLPLEAARANAIIWNQNICMPTDKESVAKGYDMMIDSETGKPLNKMLITAYHERLASNYDMKVDQIVGQKFLFSNRMLPIIWPQACKWPYPRDPDNEMDPNEKYGLGQGQGCKKYCKPPFRVFIGGPVIKNYLLLSRVGKWLMAPMNALNIWVMKMQYSTRSMGQMFGDAIARSKTLSKFRGVGAKVMAAQAIAQDVTQAAAFVTAVGEANGAGPLPSASDIEAAKEKDAEAAEKKEETPAEETPADTVTDITDAPEAPAAEAPAPAPKVEL